MKPWKSTLRNRKLTALLKLQWGHGDEAVEEWDSSQVVASSCASFNGATAMKPWKSSPLH